MSNNEPFDGQILADKLSKLNSSQQSIESLSRWCISHRKKAKQIVETWDKCFNSSQKDQRVSFLYLANDILQNSRRKGSEFVNEFWKFLPAALKHVYENGDGHGKKVATRLVDIWEERKVFGSRGQSLKDEMMGKNPNPPALPVSNGKSSNAIKIVKRDAHSVRIKLAVGGLPEKILTAFQPVLDEHLSEEAALNKCSAAVFHVDKIDEDVENSLNHGTQQGSTLLDDLKEQEDVLNQSVGQLESVEATRSALVSHLKEALKDQESKLEVVRTRLQVARHQIEKVGNMKSRLTSSPALNHQSNVINMTTESTRLLEPNLPLVQPTGILPLPQPVISFASVKTTDEENKKAAAAAVVAKLAASTSSAQMLTSVLSSLVAEEAASMTGSLTSAGFTSGLPMFPPEKRPKLETSMSASDVNNPDVGNAAYFTSLQQQTMNNVPHASSASMQPLSHTNQMQNPFGPPPPPPPAPSPGTPPANQYAQSAGLMVMPYGYGSNTLPPPPPIPPHISMGMSRPSQPPQQQSQPQQQQQQQQPATGGYYRPLGMGFYGQSNQSTTQPVPRQ